MSESRTRAATPPEGFAVDGWTDWLSGLIARHPGRAIALGNLETRLLAEEIADIQIERPVYIAGLARSGSTILLESLARHPDVATHRYRDFPAVFTPYWWNRWLDRVPRKEAPAVERSHRDGIAVTPESPEAFEEPLWMAFFPGLHDPATSAVLERDCERPDFAAFYRDHLRKLLSIRGRSRYIAKGNYNLTRLGFLQRLFPDARFVLPVRDPLWHIASLMKQHQLFLAGEEGNPRALRHLQRVGHFEFGQDRRPINPGDSDAVHAIMDLWAEGEEVRGWARYWALLHDFLADRLEEDAELRRASLVIRYEELCARPAEILAGLLDFCALAADDALIASLAAPIRFPTYYAPRFSAEERAIIAHETAAAARRFGYETEGAGAGI